MKKKLMKQLLKHAQSSCSVDEVCHESMLTKIEVKKRRLQISSWADGMDRTPGNFQIPSSPRDFKPRSVYEPLLCCMKTFKTDILYCSSLLFKPGKPIRVIWHSPKNFTEKKRLTQKRSTFWTIFILCLQLVQKSLLWLFIMASFN